MSLSSNQGRQSFPSESDRTQTIFNDVSRSMDSLRTQISITGLKIPRFDAFRNVFEFLAEYELITTGLEEKQKILLLAKAFPHGCHRAYYESNLAPLLDSLEPWSSVKGKIIKRFADSDGQNRHLLKLRELTYNPESSGSLLDYVEEMLYSYKKAYSGDVAMNTAVPYVKASIPKELRLQLNMYTDYRNAKTEDELTEAVKRYDSIKHNVKKESANRDLTREVSDIIQGAIKEMRKEIAESQKGVVAALKYQEQNYGQSDRRSYRSPQRDGRYMHNSPARPSSPRYNKYRSRSPQSHDYGYSGHQSSNRSQIGDDSEPKSYNGRRSPSPRIHSSYNQSKNLGPSEPAGASNDYPSTSKYNNADYIFDSERYLRQFGKPPRPCSFCSSWHWDKHCPFNLKE